MININKHCILLTLSTAYCKFNYRFMYTGKLSCDDAIDIGWVNILEGASKFKLDNLNIEIGNYLINQQEKWIQQNILTIHQFAQSTSSLNKLLDYCNQIMVSQPDIILKSNNIVSLPKETLITLLKND